MAQKFTTLCNHASRKFNLNRFKIIYSTGNLKNHTVAGCLGLKQERTILVHEALTDHFLDHMVCSRLEEDWKGREVGFIDYALRTSRIVSYGCKMPPPQLESFRSPYRWL